mmetsp:Transcript_9752/g.12027  ORF Transcript_9752/g.12027 Transcript_9752/m.12027 type:complete len:185 (+) Transcript_9752:61-615(+)|eukprot:CAMPEP_0170464506 /NCGR_PEP_ID=MMETSP0123-20130129/9207_1 /TAXON_ID=182087 /ORGANISM="Favella ehrenbergii, Strain Fehren 1" /LENGTH=184 /DNA_ID=CAMNT_0010730185 /DNA_START=61 /DNA_END=615 /DNA_ORIENTATION=-
MEKPNGDQFFAPVMLTEFVGSMLLMLAVNLQGEETTTVPLVFFALIVCTYELSGGHLNPSISLGVYISTKRYVNNLLFMVFLIGAQTVGCLLALALGYMVRVTVTDSATGSEYLEPNVYSSPPPILIATDGIPSYGQIMLSETIAAFILVLTSVQARAYITRSNNPEGAVIQAAFAMAVALAAI